MSARIQSGFNKIIQAWDEGENSNDIYHKILEWIHVNPELRRDKSIKEILKRMGKNDSSQDIVEDFVYGSRYQSLREDILSFNSKGEDKVNEEDDIEFDDDEITFELVQERFDEVFGNKNFTEREIDNFLLQLNRRDMKEELCKYANVTKYLLDNEEVVYLRIDRDVEERYLNSNYIRISNMIIALQKIQKEECDFRFNFLEKINETANLVNISDKVLDFIYFSDEENEEEED